MRIKYFILLFYIALTFAFISCNQSTRNSNKVVANDSVKLSYAEGFSIKYFKNYKELIVYSPWIKGSVYARYYLVDNSNTATPTDGTKVVTPIKTIAATSVTHFEFLSLLNEIQTVNGICSPGIIYNKQINSRFENGEITDLGDAFNINIEKTLQLKPNALIMSGYNQNDPFALRVSQAGVPVLFNNEWMETSPLARAEWIKFVGIFFNKEKQADSIFKDIETRYNSIKEIASRVLVKPTIMLGSNFRGTWYMPSGNNFMGKLFKDAGTVYFYENDTTGGSIPLNVEVVLKHFSNSDIWLNCNFNSIKDLVEADSKHALFNPVKQKQVYNFNKRLLPSTANDFWESAVARPDLLLSDIIAILHPSLMPDYELIYAEKLK